MEKMCWFAMKMNKN